MTNRHEWGTATRAVQGPEPREVAQTPLVAPV